MPEKRWWYRPPWKITRPWLPRVSVYRNGGDEFCNPTFDVVFPLAGYVVVRYKRRPFRTVACEKCQAERGPWCEGCQSCHQGPRCHPLLWACEHPLALFDSGDVALGRCRQCGGDYCTGCEEDPKDCCPWVA